MEQARIDDICKALEQCTDFAHGACYRCPYASAKNCRLKLMEDALHLIRELQE